MTDGIKYAVGLLILSAAIITPLYLMEKADAKSARLFLGESLGVFNNGDRSKVWYFRHKGNDCYIYRGKPFCLKATKENIE